MQNCNFLIHEYERHVSSRILRRERGTTVVERRNEHEDEPKEPIPFSSRNSEVSVKNRSFLLGFSGSKKEFISHKIKASNSGKKSKVLHLHLKPDLL